MVGSSGHDHQVAALGIGKGWRFGHNGCVALGIYRQWMKHAGSVFPTSIANHVPHNTRIKACLVRLDDIKLSCVQNGFTRWG